MGQMFVHRGQLYMLATSTEHGDLMISATDDEGDLSPAEVGMQYQHFIIDGDDILWLSRTAFNQPANYHDANCRTFHASEDFRSLD